MASTVWTRVAVAFCVMAPLTACGQSPTSAAAGVEVSAASSPAQGGHVDPKNCPDGLVNGAVYENDPDMEGAATPEEAIAPMEARMKKDRVLPDAAERGKATSGARSDFSYTNRGTTVASIVVQKTGKGWAVTESHYCGRIG